MKKASDFLIEWAENVNWKNYLLNTILQNQLVDIEVVTNDIIDIITHDKIIELVLPQIQYTGGDEQLIIKEIKTPININALCSEAGCKLGNNLNVYYGENGAGKSSYVKVFRKFAENFFTTDKNLGIKSNVYTTSKNPDEQSIIVSYSYNGIESNDLCLDINSKHVELSRINVFDSSSVTPLLNTDLTFNILPQGLNNFVKLTDLIDSIKGKIISLVNDKKAEQETIFNDSSFGFIADDITKVTTSVSNIIKLSSFISANYGMPEDIENKLEIIDNQIRTFQSTNHVELIKILSSQKAKLDSLKINFEKLSVKVNADSINNVNDNIVQYDELIVKERNYNEEFERKIQHIVNVNNEWIEFIRAAQSYYQSINMEIPSESSQCIFCGQLLQNQQVELINSCFKHITSEIDLTKKGLDKQIQSFVLPELHIEFLTEDEKLFDEDKKVLIEKIKTIINLINRNKKIFQERLVTKQPVPGECILNLDDIIKEITNEIENIQERLSVLGKSNLEINESIALLTNEKKVLLKLKKVNESIKFFENWFKHKSEIDSLNKIKSMFTTTSLSTKAKEAFNEIVADDYMDIFKGFCEKLGIPEINISFVSKKGQTQRGKYIVREDIKITDIMSEGEQKAIALAEFTADLKIRRNYCTTLFDDPVTSFDYKRAEKIADMIYEMSKDRQVIVFTHNIMFYYYLYNCCCKDKNKENVFFKIDEYDRDNKGLISVSAEGRLENLKEITNKIRNYSQKLNSKSCLGDELEETLKAVYSNIRTWCELIVEEGFLRKIIRRYEPDIKFTFVPNITHEFVDYLPVVSDLFEKSCRYMIGHSQPVETQNIKASRDEFNRDFIFINDLSEKYKN